MEKLLPTRGLFSIEDLSKEMILGILDRAEELRQSRTYPQSLAGKIVGLLFFQPSTRTRIGFHCAALRLGGHAVELDAAKFQPDMGWPESIEDTVRVVSAYCDLLVLRHPDANAVRRAFSVSSVPTINGGAGHEHHPTQTLVDLFAIRRHFGRIEGLRVGIVGDLAGSRAARSFVKALGYWPPSELRLMAPDGRQMPADLVLGFDRRLVFEASRLDPAGLDVLYLAGLPNAHERAPCDPAVRQGLALTATRAEALPPGSLVLCPLPRMDEIDSTVDTKEVAGYFRQSAEGLAVRMAVLVGLQHASMSGATEYSARASVGSPEGITR